METATVNCPTGLVLRVRLGEPRTKKLFEEHEPFVLDYWQLHVAEVLDYGPYEAEQLTQDPLIIQQQDWDHLERYVERWWQENKPIVKDQPRPHTAEECRELLLDHLDDLVWWWLEESRADSAADKMFGLVHSILATIDGENGSMPVLAGTPAPVQGDTKHQQDRGENWWPDDLYNLSDGSLHDRWAQRKKPA